MRVVCHRQGWCTRLPKLAGAVLVWSLAFFAVSNEAVPRSNEGLASDPIVGRQYRSAEFSSDGTRLLLHAFDVTASFERRQSGFIELQFASEPTARLIEHDCRYRLDGARYAPDGNGTILALNPIPGESPDNLEPMLLAVGADSASTLYAVTLPVTSFIQSIAVSEDGAAVFVAYLPNLGQTDNTVITRFDVESNSFESIFDNFDNSDIRFVEFAGITDETALFVAAKAFRYLTDDDVDILGPPFFQMIDDGFLLFETTDDVTSAVLSRFYPMLRRTLEEASDSSKVWGSMIYYMGAQIKYGFGQYNAAFDVHVDGGLSPTVIHRFDGETFVPILDPDMEFDTFAVSPDGNRVIVIDSIINQTVTLFERTDGEWISRSLDTILKSVASLDACSE